MKLLFRQSIYFVLLLVYTLVYPCFAFADNTQQAPATKCTLNEAHKKELANNANTNLKNIISLSDKYKNAVTNSILKSNGSCGYLKQMYPNIENEFNDNSGALGESGVKGSVNGSKYVPDLKNNYTKVSNSLTGTNLDISTYSKDNAHKLSRFKNMLSIHGKRQNYRLFHKTYNETYFVNNGYVCLDTGSAEKPCYSKKNLENHVQIFTKCENELNNIANYQKTINQNKDELSQYLSYLSDETNYECSCDPNSGKLIECKAQEKAPEEEASNEESECRMVSEYIEDLSICPLCDLFETILTAIQNLAKGAFNALAGSFIKLLGIGMGIYIGYQTFLAVSNPATQAISKYLSTIAVQGFKVLITIILLSSPEEIYQLALTPIIEGGLDFGLSLMPGSSSSVINEFAGKYTNFDSSNELLPAKFLQKVMGAVEGFNKEAATIPAIGRSLICNAWVDPIMYVLPHTSLLVSGIFIYIFGLLIILSVGFYLLDCVIQLGITCCLVPFLIACWPFKITSGYTKTGWNMIMNTFFNFVMMGVVISTGLGLITQAVSTGTTQEELVTMLNSNDIVKMEEITQLGSIQTLILLACCMMSLKLIKGVGSLANKFAAGAGISLGAGLGGTMASAATSVAKGAGSIATKAVTKGGGAMAEASGVSGLASAGKAKLGSMGSKALGKIGIGKNAAMGAKGRAGGNNSENNAENNKPNTPNKEDEGNNSETPNNNSANNGNTENSEDSGNK